MSEFVQSEDTSIPLRVMERKNKDELAKCPDFVTESLSISYE